jgi:hypothetical protein
VAFESHVKCDMTVTDVEALSRRYGAHTFRRDDDRGSWLQPAVFHLHKGATGVTFWFYDNRLKGYQQSRRYGLMGMEVSPPRTSASIDLRVPS